MRQHTIEKVFLVCWWEPECTNIESVHRTRAGALRSWNAVRKRLLAEEHETMEVSDDPQWVEIRRKCIRSLSCDDPDKMDNYAYNTPYIREMKLLD